MEIENLSKILGLLGEAMNGLSELTDHADSNQLKSAMSHLKDAINSLAQLGEEIEESAMRSCLEEARSHMPSQTDLASMGGAIDDILSFISCCEYVQELLEEYWTLPQPFLARLNSARRWREDIPHPEPSKEVLEILKILAMDFYTELINAINTLDDQPTRST